MPLQVENSEDIVIAAPQPNLSALDFEVDYESKEHASIAYAALAIDSELQTDMVKRQMSISDGRLQVHFETVEARLLRALSSFMDLVTLTTQLIEEYGKK